ncbi:MAG: TIR domain-containing protein [Promethearchaeota archaeon]
MGTISAFGILRPKIKRKIAFKKQIENAKTDINNFEINIRSFIKSKLQENHESGWWNIGIPEYIKTTINSKIKTLKSKKPEKLIDRMEYLDFIHYSSIIMSDDNWEPIFSKTFPNKGVIESNFENLRAIKRDLNEGIATHEQLSNYPLFIHNIRNYFTKGFNVFLSYSTQDTEYFNIKEIAKRLEAFPQIDRVFFWEEDSGENIVTYMERTLSITKTFVFFCSEHAIKSKAVEDEWQAAFQMRKKGLMKIVPVYEKEELIPFLLTPLLNVKFTKDDFDGFIQKLYEEIIR